MLTPYQKRVIVREGEKLETQLRKMGQFHAASELYHQLTLARDEGDLADKALADVAFSIVRWTHHHTELGLFVDVTA